MKWILLVIEQWIYSILISKKYVSFVAMKWEVIQQKQQKTHETTTQIKSC